MLKRKLLLFVVGIIIGFIIEGIINWNFPHLGLEISPSKINIGEVLPGETLKYKVQLRNRGFTPIIIKKIRLSCSSCVEVKLHKKIIFPLKKENIELVVNIPNSPYFDFPTFQELVAFHTTDKKSPIKFLTVEGVVKSFWKVSPPVINFGVVRKEELPIKDKIFIQAPEDFQINFKIYKGYLLSSLLTIHRKTNFIEVILNKTNFIGNFYGEIKIFSKENKFSLITIPILGKILGPIYSYPEEINSFYLQNNSKYKDEMVLQFYPLMSGSFKIEQINIKPKELKEYINVKKTPNFSNIEIKFLKRPSSKKEGICIISIREKVNGEIFQLLIPVYLF